MFTDYGKVYRIRGYQIPEFSKTAKGIPVINLINIEKGENLKAIIACDSYAEDEYLMFFTESGLVKKTRISEYENIRQSGKIAINLKEGDTLLNVKRVKDGEVVGIAGSNGKVCSFYTDEARPMGRDTSGVKGINLTGDDFVTAAAPIRDMKDHIAIFSRTGLGKRISLSDLPLQKRGGKGLICYKDSEIAAVAMVNEEDTLLLVGNNNSICVKANEIPLLSRPAVGNRILKTEKLLSVSKV
jgi:DNA gyrase subunit A